MSWGLELPVQLLGTELPPGPVVASAWAAGPLVTERETGRTLWCVVLARTVVRSSSSHCLFVPLHTISPRCLSQWGPWPSPALKFVA